MQSLAATRTELLDRRRRAVFVAEGRDLLKDKRTALVREFRQHQAELLDGLEELRKLAVRAHLRLEEATVVCGPEPLESGALIAETGIGAELRSRTVAGVRVYVLRHDPVRRDAADRGWAPAATSIHLDRVALAYEELLQWLLDLCAVELSVRRLATEIARTTKQVNALENVVLPQLAARWLLLGARHRPGQATSLPGRELAAELLPVRPGPVVRPRGGQRLDTTSPVGIGDIAGRRCPTGRRIVARRRGAGRGATAHPARRSSPARGRAAAVILRPARCVLPPDPAPGHAPGRGSGRAAMAAAHARGLPIAEITDASALAALGRMRRWPGADAQDSALEMTAELSTQITEEMGRL